MFHPVYRPCRGASTKWPLERAGQPAVATSLRSPIDQGLFRSDAPQVERFARPSPRQNALSLVRGADIIRIKAKRDGLRERKERILFFDLSVIRNSFQDTLDKLIYQGRRRSREPSVDSWNFGNVFRVTLVNYIIAAVEKVPSLRLIRETLEN